MMKTEAAGNGKKRTGARSGFTLIELLVVVAIIGVLASLLLPVLSGAKSRAAMTVDLNNYRQIMIAAHVYMADFDDEMPSPGFKAVQDCWLYGNSAAQPFPYGGSQAGYESVYPRQLEAFGRGQLYNYLNVEKAFRCPRERMDALFYQREMYLSSYIWNGAVCGFDKSTGRTYRHSQFKPGDILMWESDETSPITFNDGADFPAEGFTRHHGGKLAPDQSQDTHSKAAVGLFDGGAKFMNARDLFALAGGWSATYGAGDAGPINPMTPLPNALWCNPGSLRGTPTPLP